MLCISQAISFQRSLLCEHSARRSCDLVNDALLSKVRLLSSRKEKTTVALTKLLLKSIRAAYHLDHISTQLIIRLPVLDHALTWSGQSPQDPKKYLVKRLIALQENWITVPGSYLILQIPKDHCWVEGANVMLLYTPKNLAQHR